MKQLILISINSMVLHILDHTLYMCIMYSTGTVYEL